MNDTEGIDSVSPVLQTPLQLGHWTVLVALAHPNNRASLIAKERFIVVPRFFPILSLTLSQFDLFLCSSSKVQEVKPLPLLQDASLEQFITLEERFCIFSRIFGLNSPEQFQLTSGLNLWGRPLTRA